jgi:hypothetical protein
MMMDVEFEKQFEKAGRRNDRLGFGCLWDTRICYVAIYVD